MDRFDNLVAAFKIDHTLEKRILSFTKVDLVVIDDVGLLPVSENATQDLYRIVKACYERRG